MGFLDFLTKKKRLEEHRPYEIHFLCEKDGESERELKDALLDLLLGDPAIEKAYLVLVQYNRQESAHVALCLDAGRPNTLIVAEISKQFAAIFNNTQHLDVIYLSHTQRRSVARIAAPFYSRPEGH
jgi:SseB protein C-terminal domain